jgi:hypothetical protein
MAMKNEFGQVIPISAWRKTGGCALSPSRVGSAPTVMAMVYQEDGDYIVTFGQPPYLWRKHNSLEEVEQTYFYYDWSVPSNENSTGAGPILIGKL